MSDENIAPILKKKDFVSGQDVKWCPGCGDYAILAQVQKVFPSLGIKKEDFLVVSGIGCSSRFPYYMNTFGFHTIHGRAPAVASGAKLANPSLSVWMVTGDGDAMSIGGNHFIHILRRNLNIKILMFNNKIYGLTKGQYSPTSELGKVTKSTPMGSLDYPFNPSSLALGAGATFVGRSLDRETKHLAEMVGLANSHEGASFIDIYQNCNIFNDGAHSAYTDRETKHDTLIKLVNGEPMIFGDGGSKILKLEGSKFKVLKLEDGFSTDDATIHDYNDKNLAFLLSEMTVNEELPTPIGILYKEEKPTYENMMMDQLDNALNKQGKVDIQSIISGTNTWEVS
ncbi:MAG: 2-oxoacid:ferredoxin oxidoreductase subunit beta [Candidatus Marinimicrobia bacterium]|nr:2-oxoacid:ferredoxin oxidoreductase subunit beta [Candidatus Neomarinimicrobiota bacterium]